MWSTTLGFTVITCNILELNENSAQFRFLLIKNFLSLPNKIKKHKETKTNPSKKKNPNQTKNPNKTYKMKQNQPKQTPEFSQKVQNFRIFSAADNSDSIRKLGTSITHSVSKTTSTNIILSF